MNTNNLQQTRRNIALMVQAWLKTEPVYLDTETTGLDNQAEICDLAIIDHQGMTLLNALIKPKKLIPQGAEAVHHISNEMVAECKSLAAYWPSVVRILQSRVVVTYNADYDIRMLYQAAVMAGVQDNSIPWLVVVDAMRLFAIYRGEINPKYGTYKWCKLSEAAAFFGIQADDTLHRALADTILAAKVFMAMGDIKDEPKAEPVYVAADEDPYAF